MNTIHIFTLFEIEEYISQPLLYHVNNSTGVERPQQVHLFEAVNKTRQVENFPFFFVHTSVE